MSTCSSVDVVSSVAKTSGTLGADCKSFVTGIFTVAASFMMAGSVVTNTIVLSAAKPALWINLIFTILRSTVAFLGGTSATILDFAFSMRVIMSVISSSGSI